MSKEPDRPSTFTIAAAVSKRLFSFVCGGGGFMSFRLNIMIE